MGKAHKEWNQVFVDIFCLRQNVISPAAVIYAVMQHSMGYQFPSRRSASHVEHISNLRGISTIPLGIDIDFSAVIRFCGG